MYVESIVTRVPYECIYMYKLIISYMIRNTWYIYFHSLFTCERRYANTQQTLNGRMDQEMEFYT